MPSRRETRPVVGLACNKDVRQRYIDAADLERLQRFADFRYAEFNEPSSWDEPPPFRPEVQARLVEFARELDALVVCHGAPLVSEAVMEACPRLKFVGELEGDRFARRIDVEAAWRRGVKAVDTTQGSSYPVAEWALAMILIGLRDAGQIFRKMINHDPSAWDNEVKRAWNGFPRLDLTGRKVGLIGCGHIGRRLLKFLAPFEVEVYVYDPYIPREIADIYNVTMTSLDNVLSLSEVVVCLAPITPKTQGMIGAREIGLMKPGTVFVNVSRGKIVDSNALIARLRKGDLVACLDVFDPEPIPVDSPILDQENVFLTPHIAWTGARSRTQFFSLMVDELSRFFHGHETRYDLLPRTIANRRGEPPPPR